MDGGISITNFSAQENAPDFITCDVNIILVWKRVDVRKLDILRECMMWYVLLWCILIANVSFHVSMYDMIVGWLVNCFEFVVIIFLSYIYSVTICWDITKACVLIFSKTGVIFLQYIRIMHQHELYFTKANQLEL